MVKMYRTGLETTDYNDNDELFFAEQLTSKRY